MVKYSWVDAEEEVTLSVLNTEEAIEAVEIVVDDPLEWSDLLVSLEKRI